MNAEKISRPFAALPLHETSAHGPRHFSFKQEKPYFPALPRYTTWEKFVSYNQ